MKIRISDVIKEKRRQLGVSQEVFAEVFGVSVQAVSKWETQSSMPDIALLPKIAEYLHISMDELFFGTVPCKASICSSGDIPDDGKLRIVQYKGNTLLNENEYDPNVRIMLEIPKESETKFDVQIWGSADIKGDINGNAMADGMINCGNIGQSATADGGINCGNIGQSATADGNI
ncbi:MAG: helix-turn-helix transcriptional regulator, partial [Oscillospiraceae bacterium]|nr:helix-turn-helix transcriptional regulator [Oscillospiraceae bacterium]